MITVQLLRDLEMTGIGTRLRELKYLVEFYQTRRKLTGKSITTM